MAGTNTVKMEVLNSVSLWYLNVLHIKLQNDVIWFIFELYIQSFFFYAESDSDSEFEAFLDDDNGCCASIM